MRPETKIEDISRLNPLQKQALNRLNLKTAKDILLYFPSKYQSAGSIKRIADVFEGEEVTVYGKVISNKISRAYRKKIPMSEIVIDDGTGKIKSIWFHQAYMAKRALPESFVELSGVVNKDKSGHLYFANPTLQEMSEIEIATQDSLFQKEFLSPSPIYPETRGLSSIWFRHFIKKVLQASVHKKVIDPIPEYILQKYNLPSLDTALVFIHSPHKESDALVARKRFSFQEIFFIQLARQKLKREYQNNPAYLIKTADSKVKEFTGRLPFELTEAQSKAIDSILEDFKKPRPMTRLLEGDVGSGKTAVAAAVAYAIVNETPNNQKLGRLEIAYMAPTEILAKQHFESFIKNFQHLKINVGLITGSGCFKYPSKVDPKKSTPISRSQLLKWVANGEIPIVIGTHSLIEETVKFKNLALVIIDEQHRFGAHQRSRLANKKVVGKNIVPHLLSMTATPIPRTLALTIYGDLDLTLLDQMPVGRKSVITQIVIPAERNVVYQKVKEEIKSGRQAFIICPRIDTADLTKLNTLNTKSVKDEAKRLKKDIFPEFEIAILHSKMKPKDKAEIMNKFLGGKIDILVSTSVVEVGVNVPNATIIVIEGGERFGLAQLHQLRGRVLRSNNQAYCFVFTESKSEKTLERLKALRTAKNGFELAELDLALRGPGELAGTKQWGISDLGMEAIKNIKMVEAARSEASQILDKNLALEDYPLIKTIINQKNIPTHLE